MIKPAWNDAVVFYQIPLENELPNAAILIHRDNGWTLVIEQEDQQICLDLHRGNVKEFVKAIQIVLDKSEEAARKRK